MGRMDAKTQEYMKDRVSFAALFHDLLYDGKTVIDPESLNPVDSVEETVIEKNGMALPVQRF